MAVLLVACTWFDVDQDQAAPRPTIQGTKRFFVTLDGRAVEGDPDGKASAVIEVTPTSGTICFTLSWDAVGRPFDSILLSDAKEGGLDVPLTTSRETPTLSEACVKGARHAAEIAFRPDDFQLIVTNRDYPTGALAGPLSEAQE